MPAQPHPIFQEFLDSRKAAKIKEKIKDSMSPDEIESVTGELNRTFEYCNWVVTAAPRAKQLSISSHPSKFSHPDAGKNRNGNTTAVIATPNKKHDGYLHSGNVETDLDVIGNAGALDVYQFLHLIIEGKTIIEHFQSDSKIAKHNFGQIEGKTYLDLKSDFLKMIDSSDKPVTSTKIKQIYFPIGKNSRYHLLSIISNSGLIYKLKKCLDEMHFSDKTKELRDLRKNQKFSSSSYREVFNLVSIGYGGSKTWNISVQNFQNEGRAYLLPSMPPELDERKVRFPTKDFFTQCVPRRPLINYMRAMHSCYLDSRNNITTKAKYQEVVEELLDNLVITRSWELRDLAANQYYQENSLLPAHQKTWLVGSFEERCEDDEWLNTLVNEISSWLLSSYRSVIGDEKFVQMGDAEREDLVEKVSTVLRNKEAFR